MTLRLLGVLAVVITFALSGCQSNDGANQDRSATDTRRLEQASLLNELDQREEMYTRGVQQENPQLLESVWDEHFIDTSGEVVRNKEAMLAVIRQLKQKDITINDIKIEERKVQLFGETAVVTGKFTELGVNKSKPFTDKGRFTDVWVRSNGVWMCVAAHSSEISDKKPT